MEIMHKSGLSNPGVWCWQGRPMDESADGPLGDKTRPLESPDLLQPDRCHRPPQTKAHKTGPVHALPIPLDILAVRLLLECLSSLERRLERLSSLERRFLAVHPVAPMHDLVQQGRFYEQVHP